MKMADIKVGDRLRYGYRRKLVEVLETAVLGDSRDARRDHVRVRVILTTTRAGAQAGEEATYPTRDLNPCVGGEEENWKRDAEEAKEDHSRAKRFQTLVVSLGLKEKPCEQGGWNEFTLSCDEQVVGRLQALYDLRRACENALAKHDNDIHECATVEHDTSFFRLIQNIIEHGWPS